MNLEWQENLSIGVEQVDNQHKEIFKRLQRLFDTCSQGTATEEIFDLLNFLENYVIEHFRDEEALQNESFYENIEAHKYEHQNFKKEIKLLKEKINTEKNVQKSILETNYLLIQWLTNHICQSDKQFGIFYKNWLKSKTK